MARSINDNLNLFYSNLLPDVFNVKIEDEVLATCSNCVKVREKKFNPNMKCCTYLPVIPNFMVGSILSEINDKRNTGQKRILNSIKEKIGIYPSGIWPSKDRQVLYDYQFRLYQRNEIDEIPGVGNAKKWLCSYYERTSGMCTIWKHRNAVCRTYFCKKVDGKMGTNFWSSLRDYLTFIEEALSKHCLNKLGFDSESYLDGDIKGKLTSEEIDGEGPTEKDYNVRWMHWLGRETEFYINCYKIVKNLTKKEFNSILGSIGKERFNGFKSALELKSSVPNLISLNPKVNFSTSKNPLLVDVSFSLDESFELPLSLAKISQMFDGKSNTKQVLNRFEKENGLKLNERHIRKLLNIGVIIESPTLI